MKRLSWLYILLILVGCTDAKFDEDNSLIPSEEFYATMEKTDSRTYVDEQIRMRWHEDDRITIFKKETYNREFKFTGKTGANAGGFKQVSEDDDFYFGYTVNANYAVYPHSTDTELDETDCIFTLSMPAEQTYAENSFGLNANTMVAVSETGNLMFKNVGAYLRVRLYGENTKISSVTLTTKGTEAIAGEAKVTPFMDGNPICQMTGTGKSIRLICETPVTISSDTNAPTDFWIVVPPVTLANGFFVTIENENEITQVYNVDKSFTFERNKYYDMIRKVEFDSAIPYISFTADAMQTLTMSKAVESLEYSVNDSEWKELGTKTVTFGGYYGFLKLRGQNKSGTAKDIFDYSKIQFGNTTAVICLGDIRTLLDYNNYSTVNTENARFCSLFQECSSLISPPELPATALATECYYNMFNYCTNLKTAPKLPAKKLAAACYGKMFTGCRNLITAPELPATTLVKSCYYGMFYGCTGLTTMPQLPATTLAESCYSFMFYECTNLTHISHLPATILAQYCYDSMFTGCTNLTNAPQISATTLAPYCCQYMFSHCTNLKSPPNLNATALAAQCYKGMFMYCTNLTTAPQLSAKTLVAYCYENMFYNCANLNNITMLATNTNANNCLHNWMYEVSSTGIFTKAKDMELLPKGDSGIPNNWTIKNYVE